MPAFELRRRFFEGVVGFGTNVGGENSTSSPTASTRIARTKLSENRVQPSAANASKSGEKVWPGRTTVPAGNSRSRGISDAFPLRPAHCWRDGPASGVDRRLVGDAGNVTGDAGWPGSGGRRAWPGLNGVASIGVHAGVGRGIATNSSPGPGTTWSTVSPVCLSAKGSQLRRDRERAAIGSHRRPYGLCTRRSLSCHALVSTLVVQVRLRLTGGSAHSPASRYRRPPASR